MAAKLLARKRGLGGGGTALFVALLAVALTTAAVVVAIVLAVAALVVALVLTAVGAGALLVLDAPVSRGCRRIGARRSLALCLGVGVGMVAGFGVALLLGNLGLCGLLTRALGLLSCRLVDVLGLGSDMAVASEDLSSTGLASKSGLAFAFVERFAAVRRLRPGRTSAGSASAEAGTSVDGASWTGASAVAAGSADAAAL